MPIAEQNRWTALREVRMPLGFEEVVGEFLVGPVGPVESLFGRPLDHPLTDLGGQRFRDLARRTLGFLESKSVESPVAVSVDPAGDGLAVDAQVGGDVWRGRPRWAMSTIWRRYPELDVVGRVEQGVQAVGLDRGNWIRITAVSFNGGDYLQGQRVLITL